MDAKGTWDHDEDPTYIWAMIWVCLFIGDVENGGVPVGFPLKPHKGGTLKTRHTHFFGFDSTLYLQQHSLWVGVPGYAGSPNLLK